MILEIALAAAVAAMPESERVAESQVVLWQDRVSRAPLVQALRSTDSGKIEVRVAPSHLYQHVVFVAPSEGGASIVRVELHEARNPAPKRPSDRVGLRDIDSLMLFYRVEFEYVKRTGETLTIYSGPGGYLVRVVTRHRSAPHGEAP